MHVDEKGRPEAMGVWGQIFHMDLRSLALYRVCVSLVLIADWLQRARELQAHYTDAGVLPRDVAIEYLQQDLSFSLHMWSGHWLPQAFLFGVAVIIALCLLVGYRTRWMTALSWLFLLSIQVRNPLLLNGGDSILLLSLFWGMFLPLGAYFSVDRVRHPTEIKPLPQRICSPATFAYMCQIAFVYWFSVLLKAGPEWRTDHTAVFYTLHLNEIIKPFGVFLRQFVSLHPIFAAATLWAEIIAPILLFLPFGKGRLRFLGVIILLGMHTAFHLCLSLGLFGYITLIALLPLLPHGFWNVLSGWWERRRDATYQLRFGPAPWLARRVQWMQVFLLLPAQTLQPQEEEGAAGWSVVPEGEAPLDGWDAWMFLCRRSPTGFWLYWLGRIPGLGAGMRWLWGWRERRSLQRKLPPPQRFLSVKNPWYVSSLLLGFWALILWHNVATSFPAYSMPKRLEQITDLLQIDQGWAMFAPAPPQIDGWYVIFGQLEDNTEIDVFKAFHHYKGGNKLDWKGYPYLASVIGNPRWTVYWMALWDMADGVKDKPYWPHLMRYLCTQWNRGRPPSKKLVGGRIFYVYERNHLSGARLKGDTVELWAGFCDGSEFKDDSETKTKTKTKPEPATRSPKASPATSRPASTRPAISRPTSNKPETATSRPTPRQPSSRPAVR